MFYKRTILEMGEWIIKHSQWVLNNRGGGEDPRVETAEVREVEPPSAADLAQQQMEIYKQYFPQQMGLGEQAAGSISEALGTADYMTPEQREAQEAIRMRNAAALRESMRTRANLGGGLFGGRAAGTEEKGMSQLAQAYAQQDIGNIQNRYSNLLNASRGFAIQPGSVASSADSQLNAQLQAALASQAKLVGSPGTTGGVQLGLLGRWGGGTAGGGPTIS